ncbi:MAG: hypothetical protein HFE79_02865 [Ruminiclostridium sp.]|nr:hypothetical protein [Ruminiclostridium sp.]
MKTKKLLSALCAAAVLLSSLAGGIVFTSYRSAHAEDLIPAPYVTGESADGENVVDNPEESETTENTVETISESESTESQESIEPQEPITPQNFRYDETDGFIKWDEVVDAYGYKLKTTVNDDERQFIYYEPEAELDRLCYEKNIDFGEYEFSVCTFDESGTDSEWSESIVVSYESAFDMPQNVRLSNAYDETVVWDEVDGASRYNIRFYDEENAHTPFNNNYTSDNSFFYRYYLNEFGNYWISVQAMDKDYNASEWTERVLIPHTELIITKLEPPQNVRFDESGENILWDAVEGADYYDVYIYGSFYDSNYNFYNSQGYIQEPVFENWKSLACPRTDGNYQIYIHAYSNQADITNGISEVFTAVFDPKCDDTISVPEDLQIEENNIKWNDIEGAYKYWLCISAENDMLLNNEYHEVNADSNYGVYIDIFPAGKYKAELFVIDENNNYNSKNYDLTFNTVHDETIWVPKLFYKFDEILWDYDRLRHDNTEYFWYRIRNEKDGSLVKLARSWSEHIYDLPDLSNGNYIIDACVYENNDKIGVWSEPLHITIHGDSYFDKENETTTEVETPPEAAEIPEEDRITSITINPAFNMKDKNDENVELDLTKIKIKAEAIYDEEGLKRAEEALGEEIKGNKHYNLLDLTLLYKGEDYSNGYKGLVQVIIPLPKGHRDKTFSCYRLIEVDGKMTKEVIPGEQTEDSYIIYLEHFSEYALVGAGEEEDHTHIFGEEWKNDETSHWKECECGEKSEEVEHTFGEWTVIKEATEKEEGSRERVCGICGFKDTESIPVLDHTHKFGEWKSDKNSHWKECECGEKSEEAEHIFGEWTVIKEATENEEGEERRECEVCGKDETRTIDKLLPDVPDVPDTPVVTKPNYGFSVPEAVQTSAEQTITDPIPVTQLIDEKAGVKVEFAEGAVKQGAMLNVIVGETNGTNAVFDITLVFNNAPIQPYGTLTITIKCPENLNGASYYVYRAEADGSYTDMNAVFSDGAVTFKTGHLSKYVISTVKLDDIPVSAEEASSIPENIANTGNDLNTQPETDTSNTEAPVSSDIGGNTDIDINGQDKNQNTGMTFAVIPAAAAALSVIIFKKKK